LSRYTGTSITECLALDPLIRDAAWQVVQEFVRAENGTDDDEPVAITPQDGEWREL
jgi:hypothetical protein